MKSYQQFCGLARALDVVGERWTLLIVRELLDGPRGYNELLRGLPGIATNLLADRLRHLADADVVRHLYDGSYELTPWGSQLREAVYALGRWAGPLMAQPQGNDHYESGWIRHMVAARFDGHDPARHDMVVELSIDGDTVTLESSNGTVELTPGHATNPDVVISGPVEPAVGLLLGRIDKATATDHGVTAHGPIKTLAGLRPRGV